MNDSARLGRLLVKVGLIAIVVAGILVTIGLSARCGSDPEPTGKRPVEAVQTSIGQDPTPTMDRGTYGV